MNLKDYLKDKLINILILLLSYFIVFLLLIAFKVKISLILVITFIFLITNTLLIMVDYYKKKKFYNNLLNNINKLDKAYLVLETINKPEFYEGKIVYQILYEINKSMCENVNLIEEQLLDFKDYIEMWIHEVKRPLASLSLTLNNKNKLLDIKLKSILKNLEDYVEQVLYYVRCENAASDYYIKEVDLGNIIKNVGIRNMDDLLNNKVDFKVEKINLKVYTDSKWLEFILNQIINNSIKYKKGKNSYIKISALDNQDTIELIIEDNGIGIPKSDIKEVFKKTFTGENGRIVPSATGMGLYIAKNLCIKLGHKIEIESVYQEYTRVSITFAKNKFYDVLK